MSMGESVMLLCLKQATRSLLLKRSGLDKEDMKNYHPICNLLLICKLFKKVEARHIEKHLEHNNNDQSTYCRGHSTFNRNCSLESAQ